MLAARARSTSRRRARQLGSQNTLRIRGKSGETERVTSVRWKQQATFAHRPGRRPAEHTGRFPSLAVSICLAEPFGSLAGHSVKRDTRGRHLTQAHLDRPIRRFRRDDPWLRRHRPVSPWSSPSNATRTRQAPTPRIWRTSFRGADRGRRVFPEAEVVIGGPPCQGFSPSTCSASASSDAPLARIPPCAQGERAHRFRDGERAGVAELGEYEAFQAAAEDLGFKVEWRILNAADYGAPQTRRRAIVIGSKRGIRSGRQTHWEPDMCPAPIAVADVPLGGHESDAASLGPTAPVGITREPRGQRASSVNADSRRGEGRFDLAVGRPDITPDCWLRKRTGTTDVFGRLWWGSPCVHDPDRVLQAREGSLSPSQRAPTDHGPRGCAVPTLPDDFCSA